jgi:putative sterol carrier protein
MELDFMSDAWVAALAERLKESATYKKSAKGWRSSMALATLAEPEKGIEARAVVLDLYEGEVRSAVSVAGTGPYEADYVIRGVAENWKKLLAKEIFPVPAIMSGQLQLVKGDTMPLMMQMGSVQALLDEATPVPTRWTA